MITLVIAIAVAFGGFSAAHYAADLGIGWSVFLGLVAFGVFQAAFGFFIQRKVKADMAKVQGILEGGQKRLQQKMQRWQMRPPGSGHVNSLNASVATGILLAAIQNARSK